MEFAAYFPLFFLWFILYLHKKNANAIAAVKAANPNGKESVKMVELAKRFIGKECIIYAFDSNHSCEGLIKEVSDGAVLIARGDQLEAINLAFVSRIREYPKNKKGKKQSIVLD